MHIRLGALLLLILLAADSPALAEGYPARRAGHWELTLTLESGAAPPQTIQQCVDPESDDLLQSFGGLITGGTSCATTQRKDGANLHVDTTCQVSPTISSTLQAVFAGDFNASYTVRATLRVDGEPAAAKTPTRITLITAKWLGACKPDQRPGDLITPDGKRMNVIDFFKAMDQLKIELKKKKSGNP